MSNINNHALAHQQEQLFVELTVEEAAMLEGGYQMYLGGIYTKYTNADQDGVSEVYMTIDGQKVWGPNSMDEGTSYKIGKSYNVSPGSKIGIWDADQGSGPDLLGMWTVKPTDGLQTIPFGSNQNQTAGAFSANVD